MAVQQGYGKMAGTDALVFAYDTGDAVNSYKGEPTENLISQMIGTTTVNYPEVVYRCTEVETNVADSSVPSGFYSRFTGIDSSDNNQLYSRFNTANIDVRNQTVSYSVYLKGSGTCHLSIYADNVGYGTTSTITLTSEWTRYSYTRPLTEYTSNAWVAVRGVLNTTDVYISSQQAELKNHSTPFVIDGRSATGGLLDLTGNETVGLTNVSFDSDAQMTFDGTDDSIVASTFNLGSDPIFSISMLIKRTASFNNGGYWGLGGGTSERGICGYTSSTNKIGWDLWGRTTFHTNQDYPLNEWVHVCWVKTQTGFTTSSLKVFINGEEVPLSVTRRNNSSTVNLLDGLAIGRISDNHNGYYAPGKIAITKLYNKALTAAEVKSNFNNYKTRFNIA